MSTILQQIAHFTLQSVKHLDLYSSTGESARFSLEQLFVRPRLATPKGEIVDSSMLISNKNKAIIIGTPGSGKTTLLKFFAYEYAKNFLDGKDTGLCPLFFRAHELLSKTSSEGLIDQIIAVIHERNQYHFEKVEFRKYLSESSFVLLIDGLDEIAIADHRIRFFSLVNDLSRAFTSLSILMTSRPAALTVPFHDFLYFHLEPFDVEQVRHLIQLWFREHPQRANQFFHAIQSSSALYALASNPLLLNLLWRVYEANRSLPANLTSLYNDCTDYLLSTWERAKGIHRATISLHEKHSVLEYIGYNLLTNKQNYTTREELKASLETYFRQYDISDEDVPSFLYELLSSGILQEVGENRISFIHRTFLEYYTARAISNDPLKVIQLVSQNEFHDVVIMACGLLVDVAPIIEAAVERREVLLAAKCVSNGRTKNKRLAEYVISSFIHEVGDTFVNQLVDFFQSHEPYTKTSDTHFELLNLWDRALDEELTSHQKGRQFEEFSSAFLAKLFKIVRRDYNTENGEIDLVCEIVKSDPFWADFGGEVLIECKNWNTHIPLKEIGSFADKVAQARGIKLAFFISVSGFTEDAIRTLMNRAGDVSKPLIIPINGDQIKRALLQKDDIEEFFKEIIRDMKYLRKY